MEEKITMKNNIKILIAAHKACDVPNSDIYIPVQVGAELHKNLNLGFQKDNEGDNISTLNPYYCELTAIYWAWKNLDADYIGLSHYRRHFKFKKKNSEFNSILNSEEAEKLCAKYDLILPVKRKLYIETVYSHYDHTFYGEQFDQARDIISSMCPEYLDAFDKHMKERSEHLFNMFIMKKELFHRYCEWLFPILKELESKYDLKNMDAFQARLIGRVAERLLDVWIEKNDIKYKEIGYIYFGKQNMPKKILGFIMAKLFHVKYDKSF